MPNLHGLDHRKSTAPLKSGAKAPQGLTGHHSQEVGECGWEGGGGELLCHELPKLNRNAQIKASEQHGLYVWHRAIACARTAATDIRAAQTYMQVQIADNVRVRELKRVHASSVRASMTQLRCAEVLHLSLERHDEANGAQEIQSV